MSNVALNTPSMQTPNCRFWTTQEKTLDGGREEFYRYEWFVSFMLLACDAVLVLDSRGWKRVVTTNLGYHRDYLMSEIFKTEGVPLQSDAIKAMIGDLGQNNAH